MKLLVVKSLQEANDSRVALIPTSIKPLGARKVEVIIERGCGVRSSYGDEAYRHAGATIVEPGDAAAWSAADAVATVSSISSAQVLAIRSGALLIGLLSPYKNGALMQQLAAQGVTTFSLELLPRISRAQSMDVLTSQASIAGYKAVILAADHCPKLFPMMMTAAGTITAARVLVLGAGVAGLQAIATARRLGAVVEAFDVRPAVKEQVESFGARFVVVEAPQDHAQDAGGYAKEMSAAYQEKQKQVLHQHVKDADVVITTALIPGKPAPRLITAEMVHDMKLGSVIVDLASENGGNCELTQAGKNVDVGGKLIMGPLNLPGTLPFHASQMYSRNVTALLTHLTTKEGAVTLDMQDQITSETMVTHAGEVVNPRVRQALGLVEATVSGRV